MSNFKDMKGNDISFEDVGKFIEKGHKYEVYVGTDSQVHKKIKKVIYASCIVVYKKGKGGRVFVSREKERYANSLRQRLMNETWRSLEIALELQKILPKDVELVVHVDVNKNKKWKSSKYVEELVGMIVGQGLKVVVKPDAWAAQHCADKFSR